MNEQKRQQVLALGRLGWPLRRIEKQTGVRRETASACLKAAGIAVRPPGGWTTNGVILTCVVFAMGDSVGIVIYEKPVIVTSFAGFQSADCLRAGHDADTLLLVKPWPYAAFS